MMSSLTEPRLQTAAFPAAASFFFRQILNPEVYDGQIFSVNRECFRVFAAFCLETVAVFRQPGRPK
jgi:hypothetical protein